MNRPLSVPQRLLPLFLIVLTIPAPAAKPVVTHDPTLAGLPANARALAIDSLRLGDEAFDPTTNLLVRPVDTHNPEPNMHVVRESGWYAVGLLLRNGPGDNARARAIINQVLANQYTQPGVKWFGTFRRTTVEPEPHTGDRAFSSYDPNWRVFVGTTLEMILIEFPDRIPAELRGRMMHAINLAVEGEQKDGRLKVTYTNIALLYGALWDYASSQAKDADQQKQAAAWTAEVYRLFRLHDSFEEYNSPTYYGTDLYGLAFWRRYGTTPMMRENGKAMEEAMWSDIAAYYSSRLRNIAGPYDRSYGMDMESYVAVTGYWLRSMLPVKLAPLPEVLTLKTDHIADIWMAPMVDILGANIPAPALAEFRSFSGPHQVTRVIDDQRRATAWIGRDAIWGGEFTSLTRDVQGATQFHAAVVQWRTPSGPVGWIKLTVSPKLNVVADEHGLSIETNGDVTFRINAAGLEAVGLSAKEWKAPGMVVAVDTDGGAVAPVSVTPLGQDAAAFDVKYTGVHHMQLTMRPTTLKH